MNMGKQIQKYRKEKRLTQRELAEKCGVATGTIQQYELGKRQPRLEQLRVISNALGIALYQLTDGDYSSFSPEELQKDFLKTAIQLDDFHEMIAAKALEEENVLLADFRILNEKGRKEAQKRVSELTELKRYTETEEPHDRD